MPRAFSISSRGGARRVYWASDLLTEWLIYFALLFGPWAFGTTKTWSVNIMNSVGYALGLLLLLKVIVRSLGYRPIRWTYFSGKNESSRWIKGERRFTRMLGAGTVCILVYCLTSAWNARAVYHPEQWRFEYRNAVRWLPHSYDQASSWKEFSEYLGLAGFFWALRDWLLTVSDKERGHWEVTAISIKEGRACLIGSADCSGS